MIKLIQPVDNPVISQLFGADFSWYNPAKGRTEMFYAGTYGLKGHPGIDYSCPIGTPIKSAHNGVCMYAAFDIDNGNLVQIWNEQEGFKTLYGHNSAFKVKQGDIVNQGQIIALSGNTGASTGPHCHFGLKETREGGNTKYPDNGYNGAIDPKPYFINKDNMTIKKEAGKASIYLINEEQKSKTMIVDMQTLASLGGNFEEVPSLSGYKDNGTLVFVERIIN